ncbi:hypothetical protein RHMOL_Rhmol04G0338800 [Rhododendron molle]|uniref:Uncharacterized protein n=1 Tax=Rhododendron molle TaxID=49168 RepID=A0ACC0P8F7_RHOML|nr:hypothetical protein RHMOL_Rhmol04G0338800 [Rhododendron molle]
MQPWGNHSSKRHGLLQSKSKGLIHVQLSHSIRQFPVERVHQRAQKVLDHHDPHPGPRAYPPPRPKRNQLEVVPPRVHLRVLPAHEPLRVELQRVFPDVGVPPNRPYVHAQPRVLGHVVAVHFARFGRDPGEVERGGRVLPVGFFAYRLQVRQFRHVGLL